MIVKHYTTEEDALKDCPEGHRVVPEGNAVRRFRILGPNEFTSEERFSMGTSQTRESCYSTIRPAP